MEVDYLNTELLSLFEDFETKIKAEDKLNPEKDEPNGKYNFYIPKIRDYLLVYLDEQITTRNYTNRERLYFEKVFNREYLIEATMYYVENCKTRGVSTDSNEKRTNSINDFLIAYNHFYDIVLKLQYNITLFQTDDLLPDVRSRLENKGYILLESEQFPAIQQAEYTFICEYFRNLSPLQEKQLQVWIVLQLSFLYGLSFSTIRNLKVQNIDLNTRTIRITSKSKDEIITLELPYSIFKNIEMHIQNSNLKENDLLFFTCKNNIRQNKPIASSFLSEEFNAIKELYLSHRKHDEFIGNRFTHYGVIKYAIANMLECNMTIPTIVNLTGRDIKFILSCKPEKTLKSHEQSNYINSKIRSIDTFMNFNY